MAGNTGRASDRRVLFKKAVSWFACSVVLFTGSTLVVRRLSRDTNSDHTTARLHAHISAPIGAARSSALNASPEPAQSSAAPWRPAARAGGQRMLRSWKELPNTGSTPAHRVSTALESELPRADVFDRAEERAAPPNVRFEKLDLALRNVVATGDPTPQRVIIQIMPGGDAAATNALAEARVAIHTRYPSMGMVAATLSPQDLVPLSAAAAIVHLSVDAVVGGQALTSSEILYETLGLKQGGGILSGGSSFAGDKIGVAVIDSGIETSKDIEAVRITAFYDFTKGGIKTTPCDDYGHGTHVAGLIGGSGDLSSDKREGIASKVRFVGYKVLDSTGAGYTSAVIGAIEHAITNKQRLGIDVMNLSLGHPIFEPAASDPLVQVVERAVAAGIVVVVSAGNMGIDPQTAQPGYAGITSPGNAPSAITVGAVDIKNTATRSDDTVADYSSRGPTWYDAFMKPDIVAPGRHVVAKAALKSALYRDYPKLRVRAASDEAAPNGDYMRLSGTSMAAAATSGVVALVLEANRAKDDKFSIAPNAVKAILQFTSFDMGLDLLTQGAGSLNASGAVRLAEATDARAPVGAAWGGFEVAASDIVGGQPLAWSQRLVWGDRLIWGDTIYTNEPAWALRVVWGDRIIWGDRLVWGDGLAWGDRLVWGDTSSIIWGLRLVWGDRIIWGDAALGYGAGTTVVYGDRLVWGDVDLDRLIWGDLTLFSFSGISTGASTASVSVRD